MSSAAKDSTCPHCGKPALVRDFLSGKLKCQSCFISGIERGARPEAVPVEGIDKQTAETLITAATNDDQVVDKYFAGGAVELFIVQFIRVSDEKYIPDLSVDVNRAEFQRWRLAEAVEKEKRWGRDNLRERGLTVQKKVRENGRLLKIIACEESYEEGVGLLAIQEAAAVCRRHLKTPIPELPNYTEQDLIDCTKETERYLEELRRDRDS
jgi:hypothetical protein